MKLIFIYANLRAGGGWKKVTYQLYKGIWS